MSAWWLVALLGINAAGFAAIVSVQQLQLSQLRRVFELLAEVRARPRTRPVLPVRSASPQVTHPHHSTDSPPTKKTPAATGVKTQESR